MGYGKKLLNKDYQYCDLLGNELLKDCLGAYTNEELKNLQEEDWAIIELKRELRNKVGNEEKKLSSGMKPSSASKVYPWRTYSDNYGEKNKQQASVEKPSDRRIERRCSLDA